MPTIIKSNEQDFGYGPFNKPPYGLLTALLPKMSKQDGCTKRIVFDIRKLPPGQSSFPYHYHRNAEEVMFVISGSMTLRTKEGMESVCEGDILHFETGESGAHQFFNHTEQPCTYFDVKSFCGIDVVMYPDSGKLMISQYNEVFDKTTQVDYFLGEEKLSEKWDVQFPEQQDKQ
jgi:uncharacterized cupin superfamily protein